MTKPSRGPSWSLLLFDLAVVAAVLVGLDRWLQWNLALPVMLGGFAFLAPILLFRRWPAGRQCLREGIKRSIIWGFSFDWARWSGAAVDGGIVGFLTVAASRLLTWELHPSNALWLGLVVGVGSAFTSRRPVGGTGAGAARVVISGVVFMAAAAACSRSWSHVPSLYHAVYLGLVAWLVSGGWQLLVAKLEPVRAKSWRENLRLVIVVTVPVWIFEPLLTPRFWGGLDARWYGYAMIDALQQARAGVFPVWVGQGEYMFNGAIHPFRTAPYHQHLGILLDGLSLRTLKPLAIQHLTIVVSALQASLLGYLAFAALAPARRTVAAVLAALFITAPLLAAYVYTQEMYMTAMAFGFLPLVLYANVRLLEKSDGIGFGLLAAGLALMWMAHAPVGFWMTLGTVGIQGLRLLTWDWNRAAWLRALAGGAIFAALSLYYFVSILELAPDKTGGTAILVVVGPVLLLGMGGLLRFMVSQDRRWFAAIGPAVAILFPIYSSYAEWLLVAALMGVLLTRSKWRSELPVGRFMLALLVGGVAVSRFAPGQFPPWMVPMFDAAWAALVNNFPGNISPISPGALALSDLQIGYSCWLLLGLGWWGVWRYRERELWVICAVASVIAALELPIPWVTSSLLSFIPAPLYGVGGIALWLRFSPVLLGLCLFAGGWVLLKHAWPGRERYVIGAIVLALAWNVAEMEKIIGRGRAAVAPAKARDDYLRLENARSYSYNYDNLKATGYVVNGVVDYYLESRLLQPGTQAVIPEPALRGSPAFMQPFAGKPDSNDPNWLQLAPKLTLDPGERLALEFQFKDLNYTGSLIMRGSDGFYRDYQLPDAGPQPQSFGVDPQRPKMLAIWNSTSRPEQMEMSFLGTADGAQERASARPFLTITARRYVPANLQIKVHGLIPYRADVDLTEPALLETLRAFIPGYVARVNGKEVPVQNSQQHLVMIPLERGHNTVELTYRGTWKLKLALGFSAVAWLGLLIAGVRAFRRPSAASVAM